MSIITLTSDWQKNDYYSAVVKAKILSKLPDAQILEINHQIENFDINQMAFVLSACLEDFPSGTVHIAAVQTHTQSSKGFLIGVYQGQYIICADNGLLGLLEQKIEAVYRVEKPLNTFPEADQFAPIAVLLSQNHPVADLGKPEALNNMDLKSYPIVESQKITAQIRFIDSYGNAHLNLKQDAFESARDGRAFSICIQSMTHRIEAISNHYDEVKSGEFFAIFNHLGFLEIGIHTGNIAEQHSLKELDNIFIIFRNALF